MTGLLIICTGRYDIFLPPLLDSVNEFFFTGEQIDIHLFTEKEIEVGYPRFNFKRFKVPHLPWPFPTLYRYKFFTQFRGDITSDAVYYLDVDMKFVAPVGKEILPDDRGLVAVRHPGYYKGGWGDYGTIASSLAFVPKNQRLGYFAGGFQGGANKVYLDAVAQMAKNIDEDRENRITAQWHDESHWNKWLSQHPFKELTPSYCFPEAAWAIDLPYEKKIIALDKNHSKIRQ